MQLTISSPVIWLYPEKVDLVYIDGNHSYEKVCEDIEMTLPLIKDTGYISGHDYVDIEWSGVIKAVKDKLKVEPEVFPDTSWLIKMSDLNANTIDQAKEMIRGTAKSMGIEVGG